VQTVHEESGVGGLDVLVDLGGRLLDDEGPEGGDAGDELLAASVEILSASELLADWKRLVSWVPCFVRERARLAQHTHLKLNLLELILESLKLLVVDDGDLDLGRHFG
jgi:hypothetical protein